MTLGLLSPQQDCVGPWRGVALHSEPYKDEFAGEKGGAVNGLSDVVVHWGDCGVANIVDISCVVTEVTVSRRQCRRNGDALLNKLNRSKS